MKKKSLEIITALASVVIFILLIVAVKVLMPALAGYGYVGALLVLIIVMSIAGLKLAQIPDK